MFRRVKRKLQSYTEALKWWVTLDSKFGIITDIEGKIKNVDKINGTDGNRQRER